MPQALLALCCLALTTTGCSTKLQAWERGTLAKPQMSPSPNQQLLSLRDHVYSSKEASSGGIGAGGGGCGCN